VRDTLPTLARGSASPREPVGTAASIAPIALTRRVRACCRYGVIAMRSSIPAAPFSQPRCPMTSGRANRSRSGRRALHGLTALLRAPFWHVGLRLKAAHAMRRAASGMDSRRCTSVRQRASEPVCPGKKAAPLSAVSISFCPGAHWRSFCSEKLRDQGHSCGRELKRVSPEVSGVR
jgi:hypothetical protein